MCVCVFRSSTVKKGGGDRAIQSPCRSGAGPVIRVWEVVAW